MTEEKYTMFRNRLTKVNRHYGRHARRLQVSCYRIYDHDLPEFPIFIEFYGNHLYVSEYDRRHGMSDNEHDDWLEHTCRIISEVLNIPRQAIFVRLRYRKRGRLGQYQKQDSGKYEFEVAENGLKFIVNLGEYLDTGLFLDHRVTRQMVRDLSDGMKVLNLFAYTGSFSVYAAAGGAGEVHTVDLSRTYLDWAGRNMALNGFVDPARYFFVHADVLRYLGDMPAHHFDIIVMDPPTFSNSKRMEGFLDVQRDHAQLINGCLRGLKKSGLLIFSTNYRKFEPDRAAIAASSVTDITKATTPFDFEGRFSRHCYKINQSP